MAAASVLAMIGVIHAYDLTSDGLQNKFGLAAAPDFAITYGLTAILLVALHVTRKPAGR